MEEELVSLENTSGQSTAGEGCFCSVCKQEDSGKYGFSCKFCNFSTELIICVDCKQKMDKGLFKPLSFLQHDQEHASVELV